ncbi:MAG: UvrD-helicase domain-containing protein [Opitutaceae bacterium]|nr:UvrD-helicase domain-containing protein [Opitutaceae bacterium]
MNLPHVMIRASAGSGKTYALTNRFVALLASGAAPERIVALTFTRKAAGEFFDEILRKLAKAARDGREAAKLAREIERPELREADFLRLLRGVTAAMPRLRLGTLDAFFARIARAFPLELGLGGEFEVLQAHAAHVERQRVLGRMFAQADGGLGEAQREFIEAFKRATFGTEEKRLAARLDRFLDEHHEAFLAAPDGACWGHPARIWPEGSEWLAPSARKISDVIASLRRELAEAAGNEKQTARWEALFAAVAEWRPGAPLPRAITYMLEHALEVWPQLGREIAEVIVERKKMALTPAAGADLAVLVRHVFAGVLTAHLESTRGIHAVLRGYEGFYDEAVRRAGRLTFGDVQRLLQPDAGGPQLGGGRMMIDFRLDGQFDHWLLDEFQDTSFGQWSVLENLIDEAVQDPAGARSFFCVGDVKQAIYAWRDGDRHLFDAVLDRYNAPAPGTVVEEHLVKSWRSAPPIISMVNAVFGAGEVISTLFPGAASADWNRDWRTHESAHPALTGHAAWLQADDEEGRFALTARLIGEIAPLRRGLGCAVLTQSNKAATALADFLRRTAGIPAIAESDLHVATDNPLGMALLALARAAAHPGDSLARRHVEMTPLRGMLEAEGWGTPGQITRGFLGQIHDSGFERTMEYWLRRAETALPPEDRFSRERGRQFVAAAALFDATGSREVAEFVAFMERHAVRETEVAGVVRVMTIHRAKGLGFDVVVLPDLEGQSIDQARDGLAVTRDAGRAVQWVLDAPPKFFREHDATLRGQLRSAEASACHEALCLLYVAMTRAKRAMYLITGAPGTSTSRNYPRLLAATLGADSVTANSGAIAAAGGAALGDAHWHAEIAETAESGAGEEQRPTGDERLLRRAPRRRVLRPSGDYTRTVDAFAVFSADRSGAVEFGREVHALLAEVEWGREFNAARWRARGFAPAVVEEAVACLLAPQLARVWAAVPGAEVWRERAFEVVLDGAWVTGVFDRVLVERTGDGRVRRATVYDFKTERFPSGADAARHVAQHAGQLQLYRRAVAALTGAQLQAVAAEIVFTGLRQISSITPS